MDYKPRCFKPQYGYKFQLFYRLKPKEGDKIQLPTWQHWDYAQTSDERRTMLAESREDNPQYEFESVLLTPKYWPTSVRVFA